MNGWLIKSEPEDYSFDDLMRDQRTVWDGVSNPQALNFIRQMEVGDRVFMYHTGGEKRIVGTATIVKAPYPNPKTKDAKSVVVDVQSGERLPQPITLAEIKSDPAFEDFHLVRNSRLSVMPVDSGQWKRIMAMAGLKSKP